ncbi:hypothetical protein LUV23_00755 [Streptomyces malaysiensis subsp. malaysiensis]|nr:hypothetical protein [Streptomyces sp. HNM0561]UHH23845.1 hypothetical protein LUV23_00755 [Streptomyces sp. HNM0561]
MSSRASRARSGSWTRRTAARSAKAPVTADVQGSSDAASSTTSSHEPESRPVIRRGVQVSR